MRSSPTDNSRARLVVAGKILFAKLGYENTPTSSVAREARTSESQLMRHFGGKAGLLEAIFDEGWTPLNARVQDLLADARSGRDAVMGVLSAALAALEADQDLAAIFLFEGRRIRGDSHDIRLSAGYVQFSGIVQRLIRRGQKDGSFAPSLDATAMSAALIGAVEGMVRERVLARRGGGRRPFSDRQVQRVFAALLEAFAAGKPGRRVRSRAPIAGS